MQTPWGGSACWVETGHWWQSRSDSSPQPPPTLQAKQVCYISTQTSWLQNLSHSPNQQCTYQNPELLTDSKSYQIFFPATPKSASESDTMALIRGYWHYNYLFASYCLQPEHQAYSKMLVVLRVLCHDYFQLWQSSLAHGVTNSIIKISELPEWQVPLQLYVGRYYAQVWGNSCMCCLLAQHWVKPHGFSWRMLTTINSQWHQNFLPWQTEHILPSPSKASACQWHQLIKMAFKNQQHMAHTVHLLGHYNWKLGCDLNQKCQYI